MNKILNLIGIILKRKKLAALIVVITTMILGFFLINKNSQKQQIEFTQVKRQDIKSTVSASGSLTGKNTASLKFKSAGKLAYINVETGDHVTEGQTVAGLDTQALQIALQQARNTYAAKEASAQKAEDDVKNHTKDETFAQKETRMAAQTARDNAYDAVKEAERALAETSLISPISGIVTQSSFIAGQFISVTDTIAQIVDTSEIYFDAEVDESDIGQVSVGQLAEVSLNSYPDKTFLGKIEQIIPQTSISSSGATVVVVRIKLEDQGITFIHDMEGEASIITKEAKNTLTIPLEAIKDENTILIKTDGGVKPVKVSLGINSDTDTQVLEGLEENQTIVKNPSMVKP